MLAERAEAVNGKIFIHGGGVDIHYAGSFPTGLMADIAASVLVGWGETNEPHHLRLRISDADEKPIVDIDADLTAGRPANASPGQDLRQMIAIRGPFPIPAPGQYKLQAFADEEPQEPPFRFWVKELEQPGQARPNRQQRRNSP